MDYEDEHIVLYNFRLSEEPYSIFLFMNRTEGVMSGVLCMMRWLFKTVTSEERLEWKSKRN